MGVRTFIEGWPVYRQLAGLMRERDALNHASLGAKIRLQQGDVRPA